MIDGSQVGVVDQVEMRHQPSRLPELDVDRTNDPHVNGEAVSIRELVELVIGDDFRDREICAAAKVAGGGVAAGPENGQG
jgi:hypothetical protein